MSIDQLHKEFKSLENYSDKLKFFDHHFTLLPFHFPTFDVRLDFLLREEGLGALSEILEKERRNSFSLIRRISLDKSQYVFDVHPYNSNMDVFNDYVIAKFTCNKNLFFHLDNVAATSKKNLEHCTVEVNSLIETVKHKIENKKDRTFRKQFFSVFYNGFVDFTNGQVKKYPYKKKLIELYLYSSGILFGEYKAALLQQLYNEETQRAAEPIIHTAFTSKVLLLNELGVTQFLMDRYKKSGEANIENKIAELYCTITGENVKLVENIINYIH